MKQTVRLISSTLMLVLMVALLFGAAHVAYALEPLDFRISATDPNHWTLKLGEEVVSTYEGPFFDMSSENAASAVFYKAIHARLEREGMQAGDYTVQISVPSVTATAVGESSFGYTQTEYPMQISAEIEAYFGGDGDLRASAIEYRRADSSDYTVFDAPRDEDGKLSFGRNVPAGDYFVRYVGEEEILFDYEALGKLTSIRYESNEIAVHIARSKPPVPSNVVDIVYGVKPSELADHCSDNTGRWVMSAEQTDQRLKTDAPLGVTGSPYTAIMDYEPYNESYLPLSELEVEVRVSPRELNVWIDDVFSFCGDPAVPISQVGYVIDSGLQGEDTEEDLGLSLYVDGLDVNVAGSYDILATFSNPNYVARSRNINAPTAPYRGGRYIVYEYRYEAIASDGRKFTVYCDSLRDVTVRVEALAYTIVVADDAAEGKGSAFRLTAGYAVYFEAGGERVYPQQDYSIEWEEAPARSTALAVASMDDNVFDIKPLGANSVTLRGERNDLPAQDRVLFFEEIAAEEESVWSWYNILFLTLDCCLVAALVGIAVVYVLRRAKK